MKKAQGLQINMIILAALGLLVLIIGYQILFKGAGAGLSFVEEQNFRIKHQACKLSGDQQRMQLETTGQMDVFKSIDSDGDGFPNSCDYCQNGDDRKFGEKGIPEACYGGKGTLEEECKKNGGSFKKEIPQCVLSKKA